MYDSRFIRNFSIWIKRYNQWVTKSIVITRVFWINLSIKWDEKKKESIRFVGEQIPETACNKIVGEYNRMRWLLPILLVVLTNASHPAGWRRSQGNSLAPDTYFFTPSSASVAVGINQEHISHWKVEKLRIYICTRHEGDNFLLFICGNALLV